MTELVSIRRYDFSDGTTLFVKIDFEMNRVSFVEPVVEKIGNEYRNKQWLFAERGEEYMNGWVNILGAMQYAAKSARDELRAWQKEQKKKKSDRMIDIMIALKEHEDGGV